MNLFVFSALQDPLYYLSWVVVVMFSVCVHEFAHAAVALRWGDDTAARAGHLTLNPWIQMGWTSILLLLVLGIAWGAVPVSPWRVRGRWGRAAVAASGPAANLLLSALFGLGAVVLARLAPGSPTLRFLVWASVANGVLFVFNLLPLPMFDGWAALAALFPDARPFRAPVSPGAAVLVLTILVVGGVFGKVWQLGATVADVLMAGWSALLSAS